MKVLSVLISLLYGAGLVHSVNLDETELVESLHAVPQGWNTIGTPDANTRMQFKIALKSVCL
jgi:hypothetical protein